MPATEVDTDTLSKSISLIVRKPGLSRAQFNARWLGEHGPGARDVPGLRGFVLGEPVADPGRRPGAPLPPMLDGITESWQPPGIDRAAQARENPKVRDWLAAAPTYIGAINLYATREHVFVPPQRGGLKVMTLISRKPGTTHEDFVRHVLDVHGPLSREVPGLRGYVLSEIVRRPQMPAIPPVPGIGEIDIIGTSWLSPDPGDLTPDSPARRAWLADGAANFGSFLRYAMIEHAFIAPPN
ncbi:EthD domain-containing protein [Hephaestia sp. GCM10023244]|uniref:EthD domain-containing protein n=1 Tax=unclassified Hephaestia TaxID=2631281 RepID=UPI002077785E|nr:EthD domain-containing protein [Hephaestia sp. MAHUQ-44]MCM8732045.1 EthD domain-containing protein [Hephaestia sp. MAHUQ-44]